MLLFFLSDGEEARISKEVVFKQFYLRLMCCG